MAAIFRNWSVYGNGKKHGFASKATLDLASGNESYVGDDGWLGTSTGKRTSKLSFTEYVPVGGKAEQDFIYRAWRNGTPVNMSGGIIGGKIYKFEGMMVMSLKLETDMAKGTCTMDVEMEGGDPDVVG